MKQLPRKLSDQQEAEYLRTEQELYRARIIERGVAVLLNESPCDTEVAIAAEMLLQSVKIRTEAQTIRADMRRVEMNAVPTRKRKAKRYVPSGRIVNNLEGVH